MSATPFPEGPGALAAVFFIGLGLNLTPCVYPMLSVTVSLFGGTAANSRARSFVLALAYVLGMATMYSALGVAAALTGGFFGAILQNRWVLLSIALLMAALAASMLGFYTFTLPSGLVNKLAGRKATTLAGFYVSGLVVGVFAAPCIGPPVIALLAYAGSKADPLFAFLLFFIMSLGLGLPYLILGTYSGWLKKLPRSGAWLLAVERMFGVILLALAFFYLFSAVYPAGLGWIVPGALAAGGLYLGFFEKSGGARLTAVKKVLGTLAFIAGLSLAFFGPKQSVAWESFSVEKLEAARAAGKPAVLDFYADWCLPCHELDRFTYTDPAVIGALNSFVRLKVDMTNPDAPGSQAAIDRFNIIGVPTIVFVAANGTEPEGSRVNGFIPPDEFLRHLKSFSLDS